MKIQGFHPYTDVYPMLVGGDRERLSESIAENGQRQPIVVTPDGLILDGRNRYECCQELGIDPEVVVYDGQDLAEYVIDANNRRDMTDSQHAMCEAEIHLKAGRRENGRWKRNTTGNTARGNSEQGWRNRLAEAGVILDHAPELAESVKSGDMPLREALRQAEQARDAERNRLAEQERLAAEEADAKAFVTEQAPDLATRVDGEDLLTYVEARDLWNRRNREEAARIKAEKAKREAEQRAEREQAEQEVQTSARALLALAGARHPEWRQRVRAAHAAYPEAVEPTARAMWSPENVRLVSTWLSALAKEMEPGQ